MEKEAIFNYNRILGWTIKPFFLVFYFVNGCCELVIKYDEFTAIFLSENSLQIKNDAEALKYSYRIGLDTLLVYTLNDGY